MPFTLAHPAILLPLYNRRNKLSVTGLVAGSMVPDFEFFFRLKVTENIGHHPEGILLFDLPMGLFLCFLFHNLLRNQFIQYLPVWYQSRMSDATEFQWNQYFITNKLNVCLSVLLGISSHLFLDGFTHYDGFMLQVLPFLNHKLNIGHYSIPVYGILQGLLSLVGLVMLHIHTAKLPVRSNKAYLHKDYKFFWGILFLSSGIIWLFRMLLMPNFQTFWDIIISLIGSFIYASIVLSFFYLLWPKKVMQGL